MHTLHSIINISEYLIELSLTNKIYYVFSSNFPKHLTYRTFSVFFIAEATIIQENVT